MLKRVCIIGVNYSYHVLLQSLKYFNTFKIVGIAGKKNRIKFSSEDFLYYTSWKKMINELKPDLVVIGVPPLEQEKILEFLLKKKIDFLCEKPISKTNKKIKLFKSLSKKNNNKKIIDLNFLTIPAIIKFKEMINKMNLTNDDLIKINWFFKPKSQSDKQSWKNNIKKIGGELNNFLFHLLSVIFYFFGNFKISYLQNKNSFYIFLIETKKNKFKLNFCSKSNKNKFLIKIKSRKGNYSLINNSKDYHNNFYIKKNNFTIFKKNFPKNKSRVFASKNILSLFLKNDNNLFKETNFQRGLQIQEKIINLK